MRSAKSLGALALATLVLQGREAAAQSTVGADVGMFSSYVWRGVSLTNRPVAQPSLYLTVPAGKATVTAGGWANVDVGSYDDPINDISQSGGVSSFNLAEFDPWAEVSLPLGKATVIGGVVGYVFPNDPPAAATEDVNTWELYGQVGLGVPLNPRLAVYYDFDKGVSFRHPGSRGLSRRDHRALGADRRDVAQPRRSGGVQCRSGGVDGRHQQLRGERVHPSGPVRGHADPRRRALDYAGVALPGERRCGHQDHLAERRQRREGVGWGLDQLVTRPGEGC